jgi:SAM-dependent methyltransferase
VSRRQVDIARRIVGELGLSDRCAFRLADFQTVEPEAPADVVVAVEAFAHSRDAGAFIDAAVRHLRPDGHLIVVDDFTALEPEASDPRQRRVVAHFQAGWRVPAVCTVEHLVAVAASRGFESIESVDLTPLTRQGDRIRDQLVALASPVAAGLGLARVPFYGNMIGGNALQIGLREGFLKYRLLVFRQAAREFRGGRSERTIRPT